MSNDAPVPISDDEVVALAKAAYHHSQDISQRGPDAPRELQQQQPGITIDLGHKNIARLPDEVIDVIRAEIERCATLSLAPRMRWLSNSPEILTPPGLPSHTTSSRPSLQGS